MNLLVNVPLWLFKVLSYLFLNFNFYLFNNEQFLTNLNYENWILILFLHIKNSKKKKNNNQPPNQEPKKKQNNPPQLKLRETHICSMKLTCFR